MNKLLKESLSNFCRLDLLQQTILIIISSVLTLFFAQNFIFSSSFDILMFRSVDDFAFQNILRRAHEDIIHLKLDNLFKLYAYGYGWLFWIVHIVLTFPLYLISLLGSDFLLISAARNISLLFMAGSCFFLFKSIRKYTDSEHIPYFAVLLFVSYPYFAYSSMSFRTIAQGSFFCILTFYLTIRSNVLSKKDLKYIAISLAACLGTKLSTALFSPLIALLLIDRFGFKASKENCKNALYFLKYLIPSSLLFLNPSLFIAPVKWSLFTKYWGVMSYYFKNVQTNSGSGEDFLINFQNAFSTDFMHKHVLVILIIAILVKFIYDFRDKESNKFDFFYFFVFLVFSSFYLVSHVKMGSTYITNYFFSFSFLLLLPLVLLDKVKKYIGVIILIILVALNMSLNSNIIKKKHLYYYTKSSSDNLKTLLMSQIELQKIVGNSDQELNLLIDYRAPVIYSNFRKNINTISLFDNISVIAGWSRPEFDYILLHRDGKILLDKKEFLIISANADQSLKNTWIESRKIVKDLMSTGAFSNSIYEVIYDQNKLICFKRRSGL